jgi:CRP/FNR family transcriptional regulator, cyclic AMP receptor protein
MERLCSDTVHPLLLALTDAEVCNLRKRASRKHWKKGEVIFRRGDACNGMYEVLSGSITVFFETADGKCWTTGTYGPGHLVGVVPVLDGGRRQFTAMAREPSSTLLLDHREFNVTVARRPELRMHINRYLCRGIRGLFERIETALSFEFPCRLARAVLYLHHRHGMVDEKLKRPALHYSQREIAEMLGVSREWVARELIRWRTAGIIELHRGCLVIRAKSALEQIASLSASIAPRRALGAPVARASVNEGKRP